MKWKEEDLQAFNKRAEEWRKNGTTRTHQFPGVDIDRVHHLQKYRNRPTNGFASAKEAKRYEELVLLEKAGEIADLKCQVVYKIVINDCHVCKYIADFTYLDRGNRKVVEDAKGYQTEVYKLKRKLMKAVHGIEILET